MTLSVVGVWVYGEEGLVRPRVAEGVITVGGVGADIPGYTSEAIQIALDALKSRSGGAVRLNSGTFMIMAPVRLASGISLVGTGDATVLRKVDGCKSALAEDCGYGKLRLKVEDASGFRVGMGGGERTAYSVQRTGGRRFGR